MSAPRLNALGDLTVDTTASWFVDGWGELAHRIGNSYGPKMPEQDRQRMDYCWKRQEIAQRREDAQRIAAGVDPLWKNNIMGGYMETVNAK